MKTRRQILEDQKIAEERRIARRNSRRTISRRNLRRTIPRRNLRSSPTSLNEGFNADLLPIDLIISILSRLPVKSIAICRCVSKLWSSILTRTEFTDLVSVRSKLLFVCNKSMIYSSHQPQDPDENPSSIVANHHMNFPFGICVVYSPVQGLICFKTRPILPEGKCTVLVICNPSTGQSLTLPKVKTKKVEVISFFGYDPIEKQFKVLSMTRPRFGINKDSCGEYQVMTLGTNGWRMIECSTLHYPLSDGICINGVVYYLAAVQGFEGKSKIACFDIRSEMFMFIEKAKPERAKLVNYMGKLATVRSNNWPFAICGDTRSLELCVLEDAEKQKWTTHTYVLPHLWKEDIVGEVRLYIIGVTRTGEVVLSPYIPPELTYFIYYNLERNTITKVDLQGLDGLMYDKVEAFLDHAEDVKLGGVFRTP
ncbi:hypothetical protein AALP_AA4G102600 [Arabis alpina]|uniref:F-box domain-containing protein n=1 Tax=Arabis alpina TaxID=50452 RepID=A0A087H2D1_ARAAL|nr:hypothetical protein AALP_AA4G102600 [Arabis alpina]